MVAGDLESRLAGLSLREAAAWGGFLTTHARITREMSVELEAATGMPLRWYDVLRHVAVAPEGRIRLCDLADRVLLTRPGLTGLVRRLADEGLLCREPDPEDGRGAYACITEAGRERLMQAHPAHLSSIQERFASKLSQRDLEALARAWKKLR